jgi:2-iminobutanoate/2-iminopropanoate deaminase
MKLCKQPIVAPAAPHGRGPYPQALRVGPMVFLSGQGPLDVATNSPADAPFGEQVLLTIDNVDRILRAAGLELDDVVKITVYLSDLSRVEDFNAIYSTRFSNPRPARTLIQAGLRGIDVEMDVIAVDTRGFAEARA